MSNEIARKKVGEVYLVVVEGDITKENVDAIVNAANSYLSHGGGVAGAIARAGGEEIRIQSREWVAKNGKVPVGDVAVTSAGKLNAKYIIHAVGPRWGEGDEDKKLRSAVRNSLERAAELGCKSISIPAISTGIFGFPKERGVKIILDEAEKFARKNSTIREIRFCNIDKITSELFRKEF